MLFVAANVKSVEKDDEQKLDSDRELSEFHKLLVLRTLRPDRLHYALGEYINKSAFDDDMQKTVSFDSAMSYLTTNSLAVMVTLPADRHQTHSSILLEVDIATTLHSAARVGHPRQPQSSFPVYQ